MQNLIQKEIVQTRAQKIKEILEKSGINVKDRDIEFGGNFYITERSDYCRSGGLKAQMFNLKHKVYEKHRRSK